MTPRTDTAAGYAALARFGPFFMLVATATATPDWLPVTAMTDPAVLHGRVTRVRSALSASPAPGVTEVPERVAASVTQLGLSARLVAVALAAAVDGLPVPTADRLVFRDQLGGPYPLAVLPSTDSLAPPGSWPEQLITLVRPVVVSVQTRYHLSSQVAWGNVGSAVVSAASLVTAAEPAFAEAAADLAADALARPELTHTMTTDRQGRLRRRSCCLIYRVAGSAPVFCGDCVLATR